MTTELSPSRFLRETRLSQESYIIITKLASENKWRRRSVCFFFSFPLNGLPKMLAANILTTLNIFRRKNMECFLF